MLALAVSDTEAAMREFMKGGGWDFPVVLNPDEVATAYGVQAIPTLFVLDSKAGSRSNPDGLLTRR